MTCFMKDFIFSQVNSTGVSRSRMCYISVSDDATGFCIMKSRLGVCGANTASWPVSSIPLDCTDVFVSSCLSLCSFGLQIIILDYIGWLAWGIKGFVLMVTKHLSILTNVSMLLLHSTFAFFKCLSVNFVQLSQLMIKRRVSKSSKPIQVVDISSSLLSHHH